jgi:hypothetical protein
MMTADDVLTLLAEPEELLRRCCLGIFGESADNLPRQGTAAVRTFEIKQVTEGTLVRGFTAGLSGMLGRKKDRPYFRINLLPQTKRNPSSPEFNAYYVPMAQTADAARQSSHFILPGTGPDIVLTSRLSGCSFGVGSNSGNATLVSHIQPNLAIEGGTARANDLAQNMQSGFASQGQVVSRGDDYSDLATVIGKRSGTKWVFYLQDYVTVALPSNKTGFEITNLVVVN